MFSYLFLCSIPWRHNLSQIPIDILYHRGSFLLVKQRLVLTQNLKVNGWPLFTFINRQHQHVVGVFPFAEHQKVFQHPEQVGEDHVMELLNAQDMLIGQHERVLVDLQVDDYFARGDV